MAIQSWTKDIIRLSVIAQDLDNSIVLKTKDHWLMQLISWILFILAFGQNKREDFLKRFATTLCNYHFYPKEWSARAVEANLCHEARHTKQFRIFGLGIHPVLGLPLAAIFYLLFPLPILLAWGRYYMEYDASRAEFKYKLSVLNYPDRSIRSDAWHTAQHVSSASYFWAWPRSWAEKSFAKLAEEVINEHQRTTK